MMRPRVLIVDDKPSVLRAISEVLGAAYDVTTAPDGTTAISLVESEPFDAVLTDIRMPGVSGFDVLRVVRDRAPRTRVVMVTAYASVCDAVAAIKQGAYDYVSKPLDPDELALVVARAVEDEGVEPSPLPGSAATTPADRPAAAPTPEPLPDFRRAIEEARTRATREYLEQLLRTFGGNVTRSARRAGLTRESLHRLMKRYGVRSEPHRGHALTLRGTVQERCDGAAAGPGDVRTSCSPPGRRWSP